MAMLPKEQILANRLGIAMHDWSEEGRRNMVEWVTDALKEQREAGRQEEREVCAKTAEAFAEVAARIGGGIIDSTAVCGERIAEAIRARNET